jgi:hypothetical protein
MRRNHINKSSDAASRSDRACHGFGSATVNEFRRIRAVSDGDGFTVRVRLKRSSGADRRGNCYFRFAELHQLARFALQRSILEHADSGFSGSAQNRFAAGVQLHHAKLFGRKVRAGENLTVFNLSEHFYWGGFFRKTRKNLSE